MREKTNKNQHSCEKLAHTAGPLRPSFSISEMQYSTGRCRIFECGHSTALICSLSGGGWWWIKHQDITGAKQEKSWTLLCVMDPASWTILLISTQMTDHAHVHAYAHAHTHQGGLSCKKKSSVILYMSKRKLFEQFSPLLLCVLLCEYVVLSFLKFALKTDKFNSTKIANSYNDHTI